MITEPTVLSRVHSWLTALEAVAPEGYSFTLENKAGSKYHRIVQTNHGSRSVHAFVTADGKVLKPEGWTKPAQGVRYDLMNLASMTAMEQRLTWSGGYLYK